MHALLVTSATLTLAWAGSLGPGVRSVAEGRHFRVECHFEHPPCAEEALIAAEAVWPFVERLYPDEAGLPRPGRRQLPGVRSTDQPLVVHLYRDAQAYAEAEDALTGGLYRRNQAFAHRASRTAHVALQPALDDESLDRLGLPDQTLRLIAHEAAHLARFARMPNNALHPDWFVDGNAGFIDQEVMRALGRSPGLESDPWTSQEIFSLQSMLAQGRLPSVRKVFRNNADGLSFHERYAVRHLFFRYLWDGGYRPQLESIRDGFAQVPFRNDAPTVLARGIHGVLGSVGGMEALDGPFREYLRGLEPEWEEAHRSLAVRDGRWLQLGFPDADATAWSTRRPEVDRYRLSGTLELVSGAEPQLNLHFARSAKGFCTVTFVAGHAPAVYRYERSAAAWYPLGAGGATVPVGREVPFELAVAPEGVRLAFDGAWALELGVELDPRGSWGIAAHRGTAGFWSGPRIVSAESAGR